MARRGAVFSAFVGLFFGGIKSQNRENRNVGMVIVGISNPGRDKFGMGIVDIRNSGIDMLKWEMVVWEMSVWEILVWEMSGMGNVGMGNVGMGNVCMGVDREPILLVLGNTDFDSIAF